MPHSSGGGSHGGGHHSGSHHSGGSSAPSGLSRSPYPGAHRYMYYDHRHRKPQFLYYDKTPVAPKRAKYFVVIALALLFCLFMSVCMLAVMEFVPEKANTSRNASIVIDDRVGLVETNRLERAMTEFREITGVIPAVEIIPESDWTYASSLESYAYNSYVRRFSDEKHLLYVISYPDDYASYEDPDWRWESMTGDDLGSTMDDISEDKLSKFMHKTLEASRPATLTDSLCTFFKEAGPLVMTPHKDVTAIGAIVFFWVAFVITVWALRSDYRSKLLLFNAKRIDDPTSVAVTCPHCTGQYLSGTGDTCPWCGAVIEPPL